MVLRTLLMTALLAQFACGTNIALEGDFLEVGAYGVGYREKTITYSSMVDGADRTLRVAVWYPTRATSGRATSYLDALDRSTVFQNAAPIDRDDLPVLVFSHGNTSFAEQSFFLTEFFASHGFVVAAPDHTGNTVVDIATTDRSSALIHRPVDLSATIDWLYDDSRNSLAAQLHEDAIAVAGHSFGGYSTLAVCGASLDVIRACDAARFPEVCTEVRDQFGGIVEGGFEDPRVRVGLPMSPSGMESFTESGVSGVEVPIALFTGRLDQTTPDALQGDLLWPLLPSNARRLELVTGGHFTFSNACDILPVLGEDDGCGDSMVAATDAHRIVRSYALAFARRHLFGDDSVDGHLAGDTLEPSVAVVALNE